MSLVEIEKKLSAADGPDRLIDEALHIALWREPDDLGSSKYTRHPILTEQWYRPGVVELVQISGVSMVETPKYTASMDAAIAFIARVLPEAEIELSALRRGAGVSPASAHLWSTKPTVQFGEPKPLGFARGNSAPLALCLALVKAQLKQGDTEKRQVNLHDPHHPLRPLHSRTD